MPATKQESSSPPADDQMVSAASTTASSTTGSGKRYRPAPAKTFQCRGYGECRMVFSRSEHLARHIRKHTGERPFTCHCGKQFSRLDNLRQHAQTVHAEKQDQNERMMRELTSLHATMAAASKATGTRGGRRAANNAANAGISVMSVKEEPALRPGTSTGYEGKLPKPSFAVSSSGSGDVEMVDDRSPTSSAAPHGSGNHSFRTNSSSSSSQSFRDSIHKSSASSQSFRSSATPTSARTPPLHSKSQTNPSAATTPSPGAYSHSSYNNQSFLASASSAAQSQLQSGYSSQFRFNVPDDYDRPLSSSGAGWRERERDREFFQQRRPTEGAASRPTTSSGGAGVALPPLSAVIPTNIPPPPLSAGATRPTSSSGHLAGLGPTFPPPPGSSSGLSLGTARPDSSSGIFRFSFSSSGGSGAPPGSSSGYPAAPPSSSGLSGYGGSSHGYAYGGTYGGSGYRPGTAPGVGRYADLDAFGDSPFSFNAPVGGGAVTESSRYGSSYGYGPAPGTSGGTNPRKRGFAALESNERERETERPRTSGVGADYGSESRPQSRRLSVMELCEPEREEPPLSAGGSVPSSSILFTGIGGSSPGQPTGGASRPGTSSGTGFIVRGAAGLAIADRNESKRRSWYDSEDRGSEHLFGGATKAAARATEKGDREDSSSAAVGSGWSPCESLCNSILIIYCQDRLGYYPPPTREVPLHTLHHQHQVHPQAAVHAQAHQRPPPHPRPPSTHNSPIHHQFQPTRDQTVEGMSMDLDLGLLQGIAGPFPLGERAPQPIHPTHSHPHQPILHDPQHQRQQMGLVSPFQATLPPRHSPLDPQYHHSMSIPTGPMGPPLQPHRFPQSGHAQQLGVQGGGMLPIHQQQPSQQQQRFIGDVLSNSPGVGGTNVFGGMGGYMSGSVPQYNMSGMNEMRRMNMDIAVPSLPNFGMNDGMNLDHPTVIKFEGMDGTS
ncbi:Up in starvation [Stygiomarasmius scandens]|uniref:Up in starvation n=3 Tax=Agaricomycetes TaxID=155619 RepID=A0ABR1JEE9_9AGAR